MVRFPGRTDQRPTQAYLRYVEEVVGSTARESCHIGVRSRRQTDWRSNPPAIRQEDTGLKPRVRRSAHEALGEPVPSTDSKPPMADVPRPTTPDGTGDCAGP